MDEVLDVLELVVDVGFEGAIAWLFRVLGVVCILAGLGLWLFTEMTLLVWPLVLIAGGGLLVVVPHLSVFVLEVLG